jgi:hypothetical protein
MRCLTRPRLRARRRWRWIRFTVTRVTVFNHPE